MNFKLAEVASGNSFTCNLKISSYLQLYFSNICSWRRWRQRSRQYWRLQWWRRWWLGSRTTPHFWSGYPRRPFPQNLSAVCTPELVGTWETARPVSGPPVEGLQGRVHSHARSSGRRCFRFPSCSRSTCRTACRWRCRRYSTRSIPPRYKSYHHYTVKKVKIINIVKNSKLLTSLVTLKLNWNCLHLRLTLRSHIVIFSKYLHL